MEQTSRSRSYERQIGERPRESAEALPHVSAGAVVTMVLATLLFAMLAVWAFAQSDGFFASGGGLEQHFCRYLTC